MHITAKPSLVKQQSYVIQVECCDTNFNVNLINNMFLKMLSFGSKECTKELKLECAFFFLGQTSLFRPLDPISDTLIVSKFHNVIHDPKGK